MNLKIILPHRIFSQVDGVIRLVVETTAGSYGFLPHRQDCSAALLPGILMYVTEPDVTHYVALDEGILAKTGPSVAISVRNAVGGHDLGELRQAIENELTVIDAHKKTIRSVLSALESTFTRQFIEFCHET